MASCSKSSKKAIFLVNHVFLPPKLPQKAESSAQLEEHLVRQVRQVLDELRTLYDDVGSKDEELAMEGASSAVSAILFCHDFPGDTRDAVINGAQLRLALTKLCKKGTRPTQRNKCLETSRESNLAFSRRGCWRDSFQRLCPERRYPRLP